MRSSKCPAADQQYGRIEQPLLALGPQIADALAEGFADATRIGLGVALAMLLLGLAGAVVVDRVRLS